MTRGFLAFACLAVLCITLTLGLWPFHAPGNDVSWLENRNGLRFGRFSTVFTDRDIMTPDATSYPFSSLEIWLQPRRIWDFSTFLAFYGPGSSVPFSLRQWQTSLLLQTAIEGRPEQTKPREFYFEHVFRQNGPTFITITSGTGGVVVYLNGMIARTIPRIRLSARAFAGRVVLGDSAEEPDSWSGQLLGVAIYNREITPREVLEHYEIWTKSPTPKIARDGVAALYLFDEHSGTVIHDKSGSGADLRIPERYSVLGKLFLESPWQELRESGFRSYLRAIIKNIVGFVPFGFCFCAGFIVVLQSHRPALATVLLGCAVSLTIEVLQAFLPTRASGTTDLITNTLGTYIGVLLYGAVVSGGSEWLKWRSLIEPVHSTK